MTESMKVLTVALVQAGYGVKLSDLSDHVLVVNNNVFIEASEGSDAFVLHLNGISTKRLMGIIAIA